MTAQNTGQEGSQSVVKCRKVSESVGKVSVKCRKVKSQFVTVHECSPLFLKFFWDAPKNRSKKQER